MIVHIHRRVRVLGGVLVVVFFIWMFTGRKRTPPPWDPAEEVRAVFGGDRGDYIFQEFLLAAEGKSYGDASLVTLVTHATPRFLHNLVTLAKRWKGPISASVFAMSEDFPAAVKYAEYLRNCYAEVRSHVDFHFFSPRDFPPPPEGEETNWRPPAECVRFSFLEKVGKGMEKVRRSIQFPYPVNVARNLARENAATPYVLVTDSELIPSADFQRRFAVFLRMNSLRLDPLPKKVFVLPIFEVEADVQVPEDVHALMDLLKTRKAVYFHFNVCKHCQKFPGIHEWLETSPVSDYLELHRMAKRQIPYHRWEPIYVGTKEEPRYDPRLTWEGLQDKMTQSFEMCLQDYTYVILHGAFLTHVPGIKKEKSRRLPWQEEEVQRNSAIVDEVILHLEEKYGKNPNCGTFELQQSAKHM